MSARPTVSVYAASEDKVVGSSSLPAVFSAPIRHDIVQFVHKEMAKNQRQAYAVNRLSGMKHSAVSWGTGRAVARIPRVKGSGTSAAAAGAFGNQCRNGRMFAPTKTYRRWHRRINLHQKRFAVVSALAASALPALLLARGHKIENIAEVPLVVEDSIQQYTKTKEAVAFLEAVRAIDDINRVNDSKHVRAGRGKMRNRRYVQRRGPMLVLGDNVGVRAFRNIFGLDIANVNALNLLSLAPGGHLGRFLIWTKSAFAQLDKIFGTFTQESAVKKGFVLPALMLTNSDVTRIMRSEEVRRALKPKKLAQKKASKTAQPKNGMKNRRLRLRLNPFEVKRSVASKGMRAPGSARVRRQAKITRLAKAKKGVKASAAATKANKGKKPATKKVAKK
jgi:large subunit ribosomal protein L4e